ncbi:MAG: TonB-dependent receptor, partial [Deltaproteobacteria bacterium]
MKPKQMIGLCVCVMLLGVNGIVLADSTHDKNRGYSLDTITVTAQKQEQNLQEVPESVSVLTSHEMEDRNVEGLWKAADFIPNLMLFDIGMTSFFSQPTIRSVYAPARDMNSSVGLYVDEIPVLGPAGFTADLLDVERMEVLRGPQGTLYGNNTEAGAIRIISRQPDNEFRGKVMILGGEGRHGIAMANVSGPVVRDRFFFSFGGKYERRDGQIENTFLGNRADDQQKWYGRGQLRFLASDALDISLTWSHMASDEGGPSFTPGKKILGLHKIMDIPPMGKYEVRSNREPKSEITNDLGALKIHYDLNENISLTSVTSDTRMKIDDLGDWDFSSKELMASTQDSTFRRIAEEMRLSYRGERAHGLLGFYADRKKDNISNTEWMFGTTTNPASQVRGNSYALFGQLDYALIPDLHLIGGLRYGKQTEEKDDVSSAFHGKKSWSDISPKIAVSYQFTPSVNIYASASKGFRSGGFSKDVNNVYDPEKLWSYETGVKTVFLDGRAIINASVYYMDIDDMQVEKH